MAIIVDIDENVFDFVGNLFFGRLIEMLKLEFLEELVNFDGMLVENGLDFFVDMVGFLFLP